MRLSWGPATLLLVVACGSSPGAPAPPTDRGGFSGGSTAGSAGTSAGSGASTSIAGAGGSAAAPSAGGAGSSGGAGQSGAPTSGQAGSSSGSAGLSGSGGAAGNGAAASTAGGGGAAISGGGAGSAGSAGAAAGGGPGLTGCGPAWELCRVFTTLGSLGHVAARSTGQFAVATRPPSLDGKPVASITIEAPDTAVRTVAQSLAPHGLLEQDGLLALATAGDVLYLLGAKGGGQLYSPPSEGTGEDHLPYRSVAHDGNVVARTGRQELELIFVRNIATCKATEPLGTGCMRTVAAPMKNNQLRAGWGVAVDGNQIYWSHADGISFIGTTLFAPKPTTLALSGMLPSSLAVCKNALYTPAAGGLLALSLPPKEPGVTTPVPGLASVNDVAADGEALYVLGHASDGIGRVLPPDTQSPHIRLAGPAEMVFRSLAVGQSAVYVAADRAGVTDIYKLPKP